MTDSATWAVGEISEGDVGWVAVHVCGTTLKMSPIGAEAMGTALLLAAKLVRSYSETEDEVKP